MSGFKIAAGLTNIAVFAVYVSSRIVVFGLILERLCIDLKTIDTHIKKKL